MKYAPGYYLFAGPDLDLCACHITKKGETFTRSDGNTRTISVSESIKEWHQWTDEVGYSITRISRQQYKMLQTLYSPDIDT